MDADSWIILIAMGIALTALVIVAGKI